MPDLQTRVNELLAAAGDLIEAIRSRQERLDEMHRLGVQIDAAYARLEGRDPSAEDIEHLRNYQNDQQALIEAHREAADAILARVAAFHAEAREVLMEAARRDAAVLDAARRLQERRLPQRTDVFTLRLEILEAASTLREALAKLQQERSRAVVQPASETGIKGSPKLWTVRQAAARLGLSEKTLYRMARLGQAPHTRVGRSLRFRPEDIEEWIARQSLVPRRR